SRRHRSTRGAVLARDLPRRGPRSPETLEPRPHARRRRRFLRGAAPSDDRTSGPADTSALAPALGEPAQLDAAANQRVTTADAELRIDAAELTRDGLGGGGALGRDLPARVAIDEQPGHLFFRGGEPIRPDLRLRNADENHERAFAPDGRAAGGHERRLSGRPRLRRD